VTGSRLGPRALVVVEGGGLSFFARQKGFTKMSSKKKTYNTVRSWHADPDMWLELRRRAAYRNETLQSLLNHGLALLLDELPKPPDSFQLEEDLK